VKTFSLVLSSVVVFGCAAPSQSTAIQPRPGQGALAPAGSNALIAQGNTGATLFTPRRHAPHPRPVATFADLSRLPAMRRGSCYVETPHDLPRPTSQSVAVPRKGRGRVAISAPPQRPAPAPAPKASAGQGYGYSFGDTAAEAAPAGPPVAAAAPPPAPTQAPEAKRADSSKVKKESAADDRELEAAFEPQAPRAYHDFGASIYLSNDDTMSLSSAQRVLFAIDKYLPIPSEHVRPHELLNYFSFDTAAETPDNDFSVLADIEPKPGEPGAYTLGLSVSGRELTRDDRRNTALTFVVDRSGSMSDEGRMDYLKRGLLRMTKELKRGDLVNLVLFDHEACSSLENFAVGRDSMSVLTGEVQKLQPRGSTDVDSGLRLGYELADRGYQPTHSNRVVLITDALANTGVTDPATISMISSYYDKRRIRLSGVGVGTEFNDELLDRLTERGKGAYVFLGSPSEVDAVFGERFVSLIETTANDVHFKLQLPPSLRMNVFYGEESSTVKEDVQAIHYFAGTNQLFLSDLISKTPALEKDDSVMLSIEYENPETGQKQFEDFAFTLGDLSGGSNLVKKGRLVMSFIDGLADTLQSSPERSDSRAGGWLDANASTQCERGRASLAEQARPFARDAEVGRVVSLWERYCSRYEAVRAPIRRTPPRGNDVWPSAQR
jgi:Ca-activated chloride channel family protein